VDEEDLPFAHQLAPDGGGGLLVRVRAHVRQDRVPLLRRGGQRGRFPECMVIVQ
jgi:hypothetical protein